MSEKLTKHEVIQPNESHHEKVTDHFEHHEQIKDSEHKRDNIEQIRKNIEQHAAITEKIKLNNEIHKEPEPSHHHITKHLKNVQFKKTLEIVRKDLKPSERIFSKIIHSKSADNISNLGEKTIARPSGIIGGAIFSILGSLIVLVTAHYIGFKTPPSLFLCLFIVGFLLGTVVEVLFYYLNRLFKRV